ncbi:MAG: hypothetical protein V3T86_03490 [Planctomycetota bacterium]
MTRLSLLLLLLAGLPTSRAAAEPEDSRLGRLIRWWLDETDVHTRQKFLESIERVSKGKASVVAAAIRAGRHRDYRKRPVLAVTGKLPEFDEDRIEARPLGDAAGRVATLLLPRGYDPQRAWPLVLDLGSRLPTSPETVRVMLRPVVLEQKSVNIIESVVLSLLVQIFETVHIDPSRVFLQADGKKAKLAAYIALHNPDRFAGLLCGQHAWKDGGDLARNASTFDVLAIGAERSPRPLQSFVKKLTRYRKSHRFLARPEDDRTLWPVIEEWYATTKRDPAPKEIQLLLDRPGRVRSFWLGAAPHVPSRKKSKIDRWTQTTMTSKAWIKATRGPGNLVIVESNERISGFTIFVDEAVFDPDKPIKVRINGHEPPESAVAFLYVEDLLEDYRDRRDADLLSACQCKFSIR